MTVFVILCKLLVSWGMFGFGMLYAFCPINDQDTSATFRVVSFTITAALIYGLWNI